MSLMPIKNTFPFKIIYDRYFCEYRFYKYIENDIERDTTYTFFKQTKNIRYYADIKDYIGEVIKQATDFNVAKQIIKEHYNKLLNKSV